MFLVSLCSPERRPPRLLRSSHHFAGLQDEASSCPHLRTCSLSPPPPGEGTSAQQTLAQEGGHSVADGEGGGEKVAAALLLLLLLLLLFLLLLVLIRPQSVRRRHLVFVAGVLHRHRC